MGEQICNRYFERLAVDGLEGREENCVGIECRILLFRQLNQRDWKVGLAGNDWGGVADEASIILSLGLMAGKRVHGDCPLTILSRLGGLIRPGNQNRPRQTEVT